MRFRRLITFAVLAASFVPAWGQKMSLDSCINRALSDNKDILAARAQLEKYQFKSKELTGNYLPKVSLIGVDMYSNLSNRMVMDIVGPVSSTFLDQMQQFFPDVIDDAGKDYINDYFTQNLSKYNPVIDYKVKNVFYGALTLEQPVFMGGKITTGNQMGKLGVKMASLGENLSKEEVIVQVNEAYQLLVKAKTLHEVALAYDSLMVKLTHDIDRAVERGMASRNDQLKVKVKKNEAELKVHQARSGVKLAQMNLCQIVGLPLSYDIDVYTDSDDAEFPSFLDGSEQNRTEYQILNLQTELAEKQVALEKADYLPQVGVVMQAYSLGGIQTMNQKLFNGKPSYAAMLSVKIPIFTGGQTGNKVNAAKRDLEMQRLQQQSLQEKMALDLQQQRNLVSDAALELEMRKANLEQCAENLRMSQRSYDAGMEPLSELLAAQLLWQQASAELVESRFQLSTQIVRFQKAAGQLDIYHE